ncbi:hypothetical protein DVH24_016500 [Malus domestica]|uniref:Uncharacterized protein n=1 Tax=Malus domestica TaxID=3750 RepID=A0A498HQ61_MALDO|nr:hypothetical protein DVH24_016500 [Malus domestica]
MVRDNHEKTGCHVYTHVRFSLESSIPSCVAFLHFSFGASSVTISIHMDDINCFEFQGVLKRLMSNSGQGQGVGVRDSARHTNVGSEKGNSTKSVSPGV